MVEMTDLLKKPASQMVLSKIPLKFGIDTLDNIIAFLYKKSALLTRKTLTNFNKLFNNLDDAVFKEDVAVNIRVWVIRQTLDAYLKKGFENPDMCIQYCRDREDCNELHQRILDEIPSLKISYSESKYLVRELEDKLEYGYALILKDAYRQLYDSYTYGDYKSYRKLADDIYHLSSKVVNVRRLTRDLNSDNSFSLDDDSFDNGIELAVSHLKDRNRIFLTGVRRLNTLLSPGFMAKRLYVFLALPGGGKSLLLLKSALDIKKYNKGIQCKDPTKRPAVLIITMENNIDETIERIYNMTVSSDDIRNYTPKQIKKKLREEGELKITDEDNIDIVIQYHPNHSITTDDLYSIIDDLKDDGIETIALILDYLKRILPHEKPANTKEEMKNITNELKTIANHYAIPVITAHQMNRASASVVDNAKYSKSADLIKLLQRDGIADAWEIQENADWVCILYKEQAQANNRYYMGFKLLKRRYRSVETSEKLRGLEFFYHPFYPDNEIRLIDDTNEAKSLSVYSLKESAINMEGAGLPESQTDPFITEEDAEHLARETEKNRKKIEKAVDFDFTQIFHE